MNTILKTVPSLADVTDTYKLSNNHAQLECGPLLVLVDLIPLTNCSHPCGFMYTLIVTSRQWPMIELPCRTDKSCRFNRLWCSRGTPGLSTNLLSDGAAGSPPTAAWRFTQRQIRWSLALLQLQWASDRACQVNTMCVCQLRFEWMDEDRN